MKIPETVSKPITYYTVTFFPAGGGFGWSTDTAYTTKASAKRAADRIASKDKRIGGIIIRKELVIKRNAHLEISSSGPVAQYDVLRTTW